MNAQTVPPAKVRRLIDATPEEVFTAWVEAELLARWFAPGKLRTVIRIFEPHADGQYCIEMHDDAAGEVHIVEGHFVEIRNPHRLIMTWVWVSGVNAEIKGHESLLTVDFVARNGGTEVTLTHEQLPNQASMERHTHGWTSILDHLAERIFLPESLL